MSSDAEWGRDEVTPIVRICPDCIGEQIVLANFVPVPANEREAWAIQRCCGTKDQLIWHWCFKFGEVTEPSRGIRTCYDRRKAKR
jgi:hypothetical protein